MQERGFARLFDISAISVGDRRLGNLSRADNFWKRGEDRVWMSIMQLGERSRDVGLLSSELQLFREHV